MNFEYTEKSIMLQEKLKQFMEEHIYPYDAERAAFAALA